LNSVFLLISWEEGECLPHRRRWKTVPSGKRKGGVDEWEEKKSFIKCGIHYLNFYREGGKEPIQKKRGGPLQRENVVTEQERGHIVQEEKKGKSIR